ncbi:MAG: hypothetical protein PVF22_05560 [Candidatus Aminicenantes bacterium]
MKKACSLIAALFLVAMFIHARSVTIEAKGSYFYPSEEAFQDIYGGGLMYGGEVSVSIWKNLELWVGGCYFTQDGLLTFTQEDTTLKILPFGGGLKYRITNGVLGLYIGAGVNYYDYRESNVIGDVQKGGVGGVAKLGLYIEPVKMFVVDVFAEYSYCKMTPADFTINIGGIKAGIGLGIRLSKT